MEKVVSKTRTSANARKVRVCIVLTAMLHVIPAMMASIQHAMSYALLKKTLCICENPEFDFEYEFEDPDDEPTTGACYCPDPG